ncbi:hypothetical protein HHI36_001646 [Cryptolaemus montrouzieri]|uniref:Splicing factor Cactin n=1 Tax=Cryptolaemus montrouzieri TaxID=559131 RepID=A0ABD2P833_9CUCU
MSKSEHRFSLDKTQSSPSPPYRRRNESTERTSSHAKKRKYDSEYKKTKESREKRRKSKKSEKNAKYQKKKHKRDSSSSSNTCSSSSSNSENSDSEDDSEVKLLFQLEEERRKRFEIRKKQKELVKLSETAEEKRLRRLMRKQEKERKRKERMGWDNEYLHYTNVDNPFGDGDLLSTFVWSKKLSKEGLVGASQQELEMRNRAKQEENRRELEKVKMRRLERDLERQKREEETLLLQKSKEATQFEEWERQEDNFHLHQARLRSHIRIQDGRAKPIDLLAKYISAEEEVDAVEMHEPYTYLNGLQIKDLEDLVEDIKVYKELERGKNSDYWSDITVIVEDELQKLKKIEHHNEFDMGVSRREGIHQAVASDVTSVLKGKTSEQLRVLQNQIEAKISGKGVGIDVGYWESLLSQLKAHLARARLKDRHQESLRRKLQVLKSEQAVSSSTTNTTDEPLSSDVKPSISRENVETEETEDIEEDEEDSATALLNEYFRAYESGGYSPKLLSSDDLELGTIVVIEEDDTKRLEFARRQVTNSGKELENVITKEEKLFQMQAEKGMDEDEAQFSVEAALDNQVYLWSDKYRPRKPRYFNRVHTGFEWNKYNQTHYDMDNPPPKIVQGYKFNIFYPDLIDKTTTPEYFLTPCADNKEFAVLRFHAGPPYEDIAFKIVSREWEYSYKRGFRCQFHNNIFQLWFHFKRYRYRR